MSKAQELKPCPFCGAGETMIHVNQGTWTGRGYGEPVSVEVRHWCKEEPGQPSRAIIRVGRDEASAMAAWNRRPASIEQQAAQQDAPIVWPKSRDVGRIGDMSMSASLRVGLDGDNDTYVNVWDENGGGCIEFCTPGAGGGKSSRTRVALLALMVAMEADNAEDPRRDWWAARASNGGKA